MALSTATVTFDLADHLGVDFDVRRTRLWLTTNVPDETVADNEAHQIRLGSGQIVLNSDGTGSFTTWVGEEGVSNPASWQTTLHVDYIDGGRRERKRKSFGPYTITADAYLDDLMDEQEIPPNYVTSFTADMETIRDEAEAARDAAVDISNIDTSDGVVSTLIEGTGGAGPLTRSALSASLGEQIDTVGTPARVAVDSRIVNDATLTPTLTAALAGIAPVASAKAQALVAKSLTQGTRPRMTALISGAVGETIDNFAGQTATNVVSPTNPARTVWKVVTDGSGTTARARRSMSALSVPPSSAVASWVYLDDPSVVTSVQVDVTGNGGLIWSRTTNQSGAHPQTADLQAGWNLVRYAAHGSTEENLVDITRVDTRVFVTDATTVHFGPVVLEHRPKASIVLINDWGSKSFLDNGHPDCVAAGIPVTWALRPSLLGTGVSPNDHITVAEAKALMDLGDVVSFHSYAGSATSGLTADECRDETLRAIANLHALGLHSDGAAYRPAWVQNQAPNARGAFPYLALSATSTDNWAITTWPPLERLNIPRIGIQGRAAATIDADFTALQNTREAALFYTHGVDPSGGNHATPAEWAYFMSKVNAGIAAGWLECVTFDTLLARERVELSREPV